MAAMLYIISIVSEVIKIEDKKQERNVQKEYERQKELNKVYRVKVPLYISKALDEKLKKEGKTYSDVAREAIEKYLKKI